jgi:hypothetical protein
MGAAPRCPRSVSLRHHHGPVFRVPFNLLGAVAQKCAPLIIEPLKMQGSTSWVITR